MKARLEVLRQELIAELRRLRAAGLNIDRQEVILARLRTEFELGWPVPDRHARRRLASGMNGAKP